MNGKIVASVVVLSAAIAGGALYYLQVYGYYQEVAADPGQDVTLVSLSSGEAEPIEWNRIAAFQVFHSCSPVPSLRSYSRVCQPLHHRMCRYV